LTEVLSELHRAQDSAYNLRDAARQDYIARAKLCSKIIKYPNVQDYPVCLLDSLSIVIKDDRPAYLSQLALKEHDEKQLYLARQHLFDIRNVYAVSTDIIQKNIVKVCKKTIL
jgi:proteasome activator subunit 3 (PA28 gamma)